MDDAADGRRQSLDFEAGEREPGIPYGRHTPDFAAGGPAASRLAPCANTRRLPLTSSRVESCELLRVYLLHHARRNKPLDGGEHPGVFRRQLRGDGDTRSVG